MDAQNMQLCAARSGQAPIDLSRIVGDLALRGVLQLITHRDWRRSIPWRASITLFGPPRHCSL